MIFILFGYIILAASPGKFIVNLGYNILKFPGKYYTGILYISYGGEPGHFAIVHEAI